MTTPITASILAGTNLSAALQLVRRRLLAALLKSTSLKHAVSLLRSRVNRSRPRHSGDDVKGTGPELKFRYKQSPLVPVEFRHRGRLDQSGVSYGVRVRKQST